MSLLNKRHHFLWAVAALVLALPLALPLFSIVVLALSPSDNIWPHLIATVLPNTLAQTFLLLSGVGLLTFVIGVTLAWVVTFHNFPGRGAVLWMALLPLAMPGYIVAYTYVDFLTYAGPLQTAFRKAMGWTRPSDYYFPDIRSLGGAVVVLSFALFPYVYLTSRAALLKQSMAQIDVARTLGRSPLHVFLGIVLPQARAAIVVGLSLVLMECLNDIGAVGFFGVQTLTLGIYSAWLGQGNLGGAAQLAFLVLFIVFALLYIERRSRGNDQRLHLTHRPKPVIRVRLKGVRGWLALGISALPIAIGFVLPAFILLIQGLRHADVVYSQTFLDALGHSLLMAGLVCFLTLIAALLLAYANRMTQSHFIRMLTSFATIGYAIPGTVLAIGVMVPLGHFDNWLDGWMRSHLGLSTGLLLSGSMSALSLAYVARFLMIAFGTLETGLQKVTPNIDAVARTLGRSAARVFMDIHLPLLRPALMAAALLVFVDAMKELPATLLLRPFGFDTLATAVFSLASLDKVEEGAVPALAIVAAGLLPVILLSRSLRDPAIKRP